MKYQSRIPFSFASYIARWFPDARGGDERVVACPVCGGDSQGRPQAHVNVRRGVWVCKRASCGVRGSARDFVRFHLGVDGAELSRIMDGGDYVAPAVPYDAVRLRRMLGGGVLSENEAPPSGEIKAADYERPAPSLDYHPLPHDSVLGREAWAYLIGRGVTPEQIATHQIGVATRGRLVGRVILPVFRGAEMVYYQARSLASSDPRKYLNPTNGEMLCTAGDVLFGLDVAELFGRVTLVEGYFDALAEGSTGVATFGSWLSNAQLALLAACARRRRMAAVVKRDGDGTVPRAAMFAMARAVEAAGFVGVRVDVPIGDPAERRGLASSEPYSLRALVAARVTG